MKREEIKKYIINLNELELLDFYNTIACRLCSSDDMIYLNNIDFFKTQFLNNEDAELSKINKRSLYNEKDKYIRMLEYKIIESSNDLLDLIEIEVLSNIVYDNINIDEVNEIQ